MNKLKNVQMLPIENSIKENKAQNKQKDSPCSWIGKFSLITMEIVLKFIYRFNIIPIKACHFFSFRNGNYDPKIHMEIYQNWNHLSPPCSLFDCSRTILSGGDGVRLTFSSGISSRGRAGCVSWGLEGQVGLLGSDSYSLNLLERGSGRRGLLLLSDISFSGWSLIFLEREHEKDGWMGMGTGDLAEVRQSHGEASHLTWRGKQRHKWSINKFLRWTLTSPTLALNLAKGRIFLFLPFELWDCRIIIQCFEDASKTLYQSS